MARRDEPTWLGPELENPDWRVAHGLPRQESEAGDFVVELNARHGRALHGAEDRFLRMVDEVVPGGVRGRGPVLLSTGYYGAQFSLTELRQILRLEAELPPAERAVAAVWPDFPLRPLIDASTATVKAPPSRLAFDATGAGITWGVVDSGIDVRHPHFAARDTLGGPAADLHRDFTRAPGAAGGSALEDAYGHGTHVAGILAGGLHCPSEVVPRVGQHLSLQSRIRGSFGSTDYAAVEQHAEDIETFRPQERVVERHVADPSLLTGVAPLAKLVSLKVLDGQGEGRSSNAIRALRYVREEVNGTGDPVVHGVNLSLGYELNARAFAAGQSPLCVEVDRLVRSGVVVVAAAGNTGFGEVSAASRFAHAPLLATINDPGTAERAITVGATHRSDPFAHGVSYFSSKGPTADGRLKPDLVAPGERITSCATGTFLAPVLRALGAAEADGERIAYYVDQDGTSMAAPHVSGAVAAFLSDRREFIGRPDAVKDVFLRSATSLGRDRYFEGHGVVDVLRALQSV